MKEHHFTYAEGPEVLLGSKVQPNKQTQGTSAGSFEKARDYLLEQSFKEDDKLSALKREEAIASSPMIAMKDNNSNGNWAHEMGKALGEVLKEDRELSRQLSFNETLEHKQEMTKMACEFGKLKEPKIEKLMGGQSSEAIGYFRTWLDDIDAFFADKEFGDIEKVRIAKTLCNPKGQAKQEVESYTTQCKRMGKDPVWKELVDDLMHTHGGGDKRSLERTFIDCKQTKLESNEAFAIRVQRAGRILSYLDDHMDLMDRCKDQWANGLKNQVIATAARSQLRHDREAKIERSFAGFRDVIAKDTGSREFENQKLSVTAGTSTVSSDKKDKEDENELSDSGEEKKDTTEADKKPRWINRKNKQKKQNANTSSQSFNVANTNINEQVINKLEHLELAVATVVSNQNQKQITSQPRRATPAPVERNTSTSNNNISGSYQGTRQPVRSKGLDGVFKTNTTCKYCRDIGHDIEGTGTLETNCGRLQNILNRKRAAGEVVKIPPKADAVAPQLTTPVTLVTQNIPVTDSTSTSSN